MKKYIVIGNESGGQRDGGRRTSLPAAAADLSDIVQAGEAPHGGAAELQLYPGAQDRGALPHFEQPCDGLRSHPGGPQLPRAHVLRGRGERDAHGVPQQARHPLRLRHPAGEGHHRRGGRPADFADAPKGPERVHVRRGQPHLHRGDAAHRPGHRQAGEDGPEHPYHLPAHGRVPFHAPVEHPPPQGPHDGGGGAPTAARAA